MMPGLPRFPETYPGIQLLINEADRSAALTPHGVDCVPRVDELPDSSLIGRRIATLEEGTFASPVYLARQVFR
ncbi:UNVERIFIED_ORG: DNA-binding transcriptional LysR family regulator [Paraburkholderia sediminicola]|nr:DNA-binding transcriptional LysR family regulator [Paraburkholderia sediminicola]